ncbi:MAG: phosphonoacetaldehyde reductase [Oscillospiraceae bacterium]|jgi:alcohol dehydrogenase class IV
MGNNFSPLCTAEIAFANLEQMKRRLLDLNAKHLLLIMGKDAADWWKLHGFLREMEQRFSLLWLQTDVANPDQNDVKEALAQIGSTDLDAIIAIGGGSVIDLAKAVSAFYDKEKNTSYTVEEITEAIRSKSYQQKSSFVSIIAVPSTAGTGSEVTQWATVWDCGKTSKFSIDAPGLKPALALIVPDLTLTLPKKLVLSTALDAVAHAVEAFWSRHTNPLVKDLSLEAVRVITANLEAALNHPQDYSLREKLCRGSLLAGLAFSQTRTTACHSISYPLSFLYGVPHGFAAAMTLAAVAEINKAKTANYDELEAVFSPYGGLQKWMDTVCAGTVELRLRTFGISENDIENIVRYAFTAGRMDNNPVELGQKDVEQILISVF